MKKNDFSGTMTKNVGYLTNLQYFAINHNNFEGSIPTEIGELKRLLSFQFSF